MKEIFLSTTALDRINKKKKIFYLGSFCLADKDEEIKDKKNILDRHWKFKKKNFLEKEYKKRQKLRLKILKYLASQLNQIHQTNKSLNYWKIVVYEWIHYYTQTVYDRWETVTNFENKKKINKYFTYQYHYKEKNEVPDNIKQWELDAQKDQFNNNLFVEIFKYKKITNLKIIEKKIILKKEEKIKSKRNFIKNFLLYCTIKYNKVLFADLNVPKFFFIKISLRNFLIPIKVGSYFENIFKSNKTNKLNKDNKRILLKKKLKKIKFSNKFESFLFDNIIEHLPKSYLEDYENIVKSHKSVMKKRTLISMYSHSFNDYYRIFLAESKLIGSKIIFVEHGAGIHTMKDTLWNYFLEIADKYIMGGHYITDKSKQKNLGPIIRIIHKSNNFFDKKNNTKILIAFLEAEQYNFRGPFGMPNLDTNLNNFFNLTENLKRLRKEIFKNIIYRPKESQYNTLGKFKKIFGNCVENSSKVSFLESLKASRLVITNNPQTSFVESLFANIPTILINNDVFYYENKKIKYFYENFSKVKISFDNNYEAISFINKNWNNIEEWWFSDKVQKCRKIFLKNFFDYNKNYENNWSNLIKKEIASLRFN